jgi:hypothetical protein
MDTNEKMDVLQEMLTDEFIGRIQMGDAEPSLLNAARQFLKDNGVHAGIKQDSKIQDLVSILPFSDDDDDTAEPKAANT